MKFFVCILFSLQGGTEAKEQRDVVTEREAHLQQIINCLVESRKQEQALWEKHYSELQEAIRMYVQGRGVACAQMYIHVVGIFLSQFYNIQYMCSTCE